MSESAISDLFNIVIFLSVVLNKITTHRYDKAMALLF